MAECVETRPFSVPLIWLTAQESPIGTADHLLSTLRHDPSAIHRNTTNVVFHVTFIKRKYRQELTGSLLSHHSLRSQAFVKGERPMRRLSKVTVGVEWWATFWMAMAVGDTHLAHDGAEPSPADGGVVNNTTALQGSRELKPIKSRHSRNDGCPKLLFGLGIAQLAITAKKELLPTFQFHVLPRLRSL